jgi:hypothetical protein
MLADLFTKIVTSAQDKRLTIRFYNDCIMVDEGLEPEEDMTPEERDMWSKLVKARDKSEAAVIIQPAEV